MNGVSLNRYQETWFKCSYFLEFRLNFVSSYSEIFYQQQKQRLGLKCENPAVTVSYETRPSK